MPPPPSDKPEPHNSSPSIENDAGQDHSALDKARVWIDYMNSGAEYPYFDSCLRNNLTLLTASTSPPPPSAPTTAHATFSLTVPLNLCNGMHNLHGGAVALIFDICTSMAIAPLSREGFWDTGHVSRTLNCTYLKPVGEGETCTVECEVLGLGKRMGVMRGVIRNARGEVCYVGEHGKVALQGAGRL